MTPDQISPTPSPGPARGDGHGLRGMALQVHDLWFDYPGQMLFRGLNLDIPSGSITAILGPSGSGKTTLLQLLTGQLRAPRGQVLADGLSLSDLSQRRLRSLRRHMGMLFQSGALLTDLDVFDNVAFPIRENTGLPESMIRDLVLMKLEAVGLRGARRLQPRELSGGMVKRVALARAVALDPMLVLYDEPFSGQDPISKGILLALIKRLNQTLGMTSVIVSHDVTETLQIADHAYVVIDGRVSEINCVPTSSPSVTEEVHQFLNGLPNGPIGFHYAAPDFWSELMANRQP